MEIFGSEPADTGLKLCNGLVLSIARVDDVRGNAEHCRIVKPAETFGKQLFSDNDISIKRQHNIITGCKYAPVDSVSEAIILIINQKLNLRIVSPYKLDGIIISGIIHNDYFYRSIVRGSCTD